MITWMSKRVRRGDDGVALVTVLLLLTVIVAIVSAVGVLTVNNVQNAGRDHQAGQALGLSEGGIAQAMDYLHENGVNDINKCWTGAWPNATNTATCAIDWGNASSPHLVTMDPTHKFYVYIVPQQAFSMSAPKTVGTYIIHSTGYAGAGPGARTAIATVQVTAPSIPIGVMASSVDSGGTADVYHESLLSTGCIDDRSHLTFSGVDPVYQIPAAAHSSKEILNGNTNGACSSKFPIHSSGPCNSSYPGDQDADGGDLVGYPACSSYESTYPSYYGSGSKISSDQDLLDKFSLSSGSPGLSRSLLDQLMMLAKAQNNYYTSIAYSVPTQTNAVLYIDLRNNPGGSVDVNPLAATYTRAYNDSAGGGMGLQAGDPQCTKTNVVVVVDGGNIKMNSNDVLVASLFAVAESGQGGNVTKANGTADLIGTVWATNQISFTGTGAFHMDQCFANNLPASLFSYSLLDYHEVDR